MRRCVLPVLVALVFPAYAGAESASWNGFYLGADVGGRYEQGGREYRESITPYIYPGYRYSTSPTPVSLSVNDGEGGSTAIGGIRGGYLLQMNPVVLGIEGQFGFGDNSRSTTSRLQTNVGPFNALAIGSPGGLVDTQSDVVSAHSDLESSGSLRVRLGLPIDDRWLVSAFVGPAIAWAKMQVTQGATATNLTFASDPFHPTIANETAVFASVTGPSETHCLFGGTTGFAADFALSSNWLIHAEYAFGGFGANSAHVAGPQGSVTTVSTGMILTHAMTIGVDYKF